MGALRAGTGDVRLHVGWGGRPGLTRAPKRSRPQLSARRSIRLNEFHVFSLGTALPSERKRKRLRRPHFAANRPAPPSAGLAFCATAQCWAHRLNTAFWPSPLANVLRHGQATIATHTRPRAKVLRAYETGLGRRQETAVAPCLLRPASRPSRGITPTSRGTLG